MDPFQSTLWRGIGLRNVTRAGFGSTIELREARSEFVLPRLLEEGVSADFVLVDGWHTFDQVMLEFYYVNRLLRVGGVIVFDDADRRSVNRVVRHILSYPAYKAIDTEPPAPPHTTLAGKARRLMRHLPYADAVLRRDFLYRDWDLGIAGSCVAVQKVAEDVRSSGWDAPL
jgi:hypothetical protein